MVIKIQGDGQSQGRGVMELLTKQRARQFGIYMECFLSERTRMEHTAFWGWVLVTIMLRVYVEGILVYLVRA